MKVAAVVTVVGTAVVLVVGWTVIVNVVPAVKVNVDDVVVEAKVTDVVV